MGGGMPGMGQMGGGGGNPMGGMMGGGQPGMGQMGGGGNPMGGMMGRGQQNMGAKQASPMKPAAAAASAGSDLEWM